MCSAAGLSLAQIGTGKVSPGWNDVCACQSECTQIGFFMRFQSFGPPSTWLVPISTPQRQNAPNGHDRPTTIPSVCKILQSPVRAFRSDIDSSEIRNDSVVQTSQWPKLSVVAHIRRSSAAAIGTVASARMLRKVGSSCCIFRCCLLASAPFHSLLPGSQRYDLVFSECSELLRLKATCGDLSQLSTRYTVWSFKVPL